MARPATINSYRDLEVWQRGMDLVENIYDASAAFPADERFGLTAQVRRGAVSIPSNIAEGWGRNRHGAYLNHFDIGRASLFEVETQVEIAHRLHFLASEDCHRILSSTEVLSRQLLALMRSLERRR